METIKVAAVQMGCLGSEDENLAKAEHLARTAASDGANIILLPELFEREYFCQQRRYDFYDFAVPVGESTAVLLMSKVAADTGAVIIASFYERDLNNTYNSAAVLDADGSLAGVYRKSHIPDDHYYQEKFYFTPGNTGFGVFATRYGCIGVGICWDQWFPEAARCMALMGADIILYPSAIGSEPVLGCDSAAHWQRVMQGHAAANIIPVAAANRIGTETVVPCAENGMQSSSLCFYGSSFLTDETGELLAQAGRNEEGFVMAEYDLKKIRETRINWGLFRDRRPEMYEQLIK
jgi:N-carbamoylputrescine amidase